jgi:hypothetical protein
MSERLTIRQVAKLYGTSTAKVRLLTAAGDIPYHRVERYIKGDGTTGERFIYLESICLADLRRRGELAAERATA